jgi:membrane protease YdiL (CAAX protease family)
MKRSWRGVILMCLVLFLNIVFTQKAIHQYYFEHYTATLVFAALNVVLFPIAFWIYRFERKVE